MPDGFSSPYAIQDSAGQAPFQPGEMIVYRDAPLFEPREVIRCEWHGYWRVVWQCKRYIGFQYTVGHAPADHMVRVEWLNSSVFNDGVQEGEQPYPETGETTC